MRNITRVKRVQGKSRKLEVRWGRTQWQVQVQSGSQPGMWYDVNFNKTYTDASCSCEWAGWGGRNCSHVMAALDFVHSEGRLSFWVEQEAASRQHRRSFQVNPGLWATVRA